MKLEPFLERAKKRVRNLFYSLFDGYCSDLPGYHYYLRDQKRIKIPAIHLNYRARCTSLQAIKSMHEKYDEKCDVLFVEHDQGGGIKVHTEYLKKRLSEESCNIARIVGNGLDALRLEYIYREETFLLYYWPWEIDKYLFDDLASLGVRLIHIHSLFEISQYLTNIIHEAKSRLNCQTIITIHDYDFICPRVSLVDARTNRYCGEPSNPEECNKCIAVNGTRLGNTIDILQWRATHENILSSANKVICPSQDVIRRFKRYFPNYKYTLREHPDDAVVHSGAAVNSHLAHKSIIAVGVIGKITMMKGAKILKEIAADAKKRNLPLSFILIGYSAIDNELRSLGNIRITGLYANNTVSRLLNDYSVDLVFIPSLCPETHSYVLSEAWASSRYVVAFDIGAVAERIRLRPSQGALIPYDLCEDPVGINNHLMSLDKNLIGKSDFSNPTKSYGSILYEYYGIDKCEWSP